MWKFMISHAFLMHTLFLFLIGWFMVLRWSVPLSRNISPSGASPCRCVQCLPISFFPVEHSPRSYGSVYLGRTKTNRDVNSTRGVPQSFSSWVISPRANVILSDSTELSGWLNDRFTKIPVPWFEPSMIPNPTLPWIWRYVPGEQRHGRCLWQPSVKIPSCKSF